MKMTLPTDSAERKNIPLFSGVLKYAPAALAGMARISKAGNDKHNPGQPLHHARGKSNDHPDCILRHAADVADIEALLAREPITPGTADWDTTVSALLTEASQLVWRAALWSQELHERYGNAPLAPGAREGFAEGPAEKSKYPSAGVGSIGGLPNWSPALKPKPYQPYEIVPLNKE